jgi:signal transduction histidine kinase
MQTVIRRPFTLDCWRETLYLLLGLATGTFLFTVVVTGVSIAIGLAILIIGVPIAIAVAFVDRWCCEIDRVRAQLVLGSRVPARYQPLTGDTFLGRWVSVFRDLQIYRDAVWMFVGFPVTLAGFIVAVTAWSVALGLLFAPTYVWASGAGWVHDHVVLVSILGPIAGVPATIAAAWLVRLFAWSQAKLAELLLGPRRSEELEQRVETLSETRAGAVDAATSELARVERDLHDGAQARLVALSMDLGLAEQRLAGEDTEAALAHVASARGQARAAMSELRDLVRGIGPSILHDRGLDAALTALVTGRTPPVDLNVAIANTDVGSREIAAYFVVAEALANARKHAQAHRVSVHVWEDAARKLIAEVSDDGIGGADPEAGSGLAGLRKRVAALDGTLTIASPDGGPTTIRAEIPCVS